MAPKIVEAFDKITKSTPSQENGKIGLSPDVATNIQQGLENIVHKVVESESLNLSIKTKNFAIEVIIFRVNVTLRFWGIHYTKT